MNKFRANQIATFALKLRKNQLGVKPNVPICPYHLAENMGLDVRFLAISSFEGMYLTDENVILISAQRPEGRKRFTCAHELGHHVLKHGTIIDEILTNGSDKEIEREADFFASMLLMPKSLILSTSKRLNLDFRNPQPKLLYKMAKYIGVSYQALLIQLHYNLNILSHHNYLQLKAVQPANIKQSISSLCRSNSDVFDVGKWWHEKSIDAVVGDIIVLEEPFEKEGNSISFGSSDNIIVCSEPGLSKVSTEEWSCFVRVCRARYSGRYQYMYLEEEE